MAARTKSEVRVAILFGILQQLLTTRQNKLFANLSITSSQFGLLLHFTHNPTRSWLVSELANVMEMNQPGLTKVVTQLVDKGLMLATPDTSDRRKKHLKITEKGLKICSITLNLFEPDIQNIYSSFANDELSELERHLEKLMAWLDNNRGDIKGL
jgi:DNA-binding MarR family transcriptional regulator